MATSSRSKSPGKLPEKLILGAILVWVVLVFAHYFSIQKAFDLSFLASAFSDLDQADVQKLLANWASFFKNLLFASLIGFILWRVGRKLLHWLGLKLGNILLRFSLEMALGILFFNNLWLGLGLNGLWFDSLFLILALAFLGFSLRDFPQAYMKFQKFPEFEWPSWFYVGIGCLGAVFLTLSLAQGFVPEIYYDSLVYHLSTLSFWKFHHGIANFYTNLYSYYPFGAELYFLNGFFLQGGEAAKLLNVLISALCGLAAAGWVIEEAGINEGLLAWTMVLALPLVSATVWTTQNDVFLAYFLILFFYALTNSVKDDKEGWRWAVMAGLLGGGALTAKYTAIPAVIAGLLAICLTHRETLGLKHWTRWGLIKGMVYLALVPWLLKNFMYTGNPFYPYLSNWVGGTALPVGKMNALMVDHESPFLNGFSIWNWVQQIFMKDLDKTIAPILFSFIPFLFLPVKRRPATKYLVVLSGLLLVLGFLVSHQLRLIIPAFITCFLLMVFTLADLQKDNWTRAWAWVIIAFGLLSFLSLCRLSMNYYHSDKIWLGKETREEFLYKAPQTVSFYYLTRAADKLLPASDHLLIVGDARGLYYPRPFYSNSVFDDQALALMARQEKDGEGIWKRFKEMGIDDLVISGNEGRRLSSAYPSYYALNNKEWGKIKDFIQKRTDFLEVMGNHGIYRLRNKPAERNSPIPNLLTLFQSPQ